MQGLREGPVPLDARGLMRQGRSEILRVGAAALLALAGTGCSAAIERDWESLAPLGNGELNRLSAYTDKTADATIYATHANAPNTWIGFYFEGTWVEQNDAFFFTFSCKKGPCDGDDLELRCEIVDENNGETFKLDCGATGKWKNYPFSWQEVL